MNTPENLGQVLEKNEHIRGMFNDISNHYDFLNHFLSLGTDRYWRKRAVEISGLVSGELFLDIACGTGDLSLEAMRHDPSEIVAVDSAENMLDRFRLKNGSSHFDGRLKMVQANAEMLPFPDGSFDVAAAAFGARNFGDLRKGLAEIRRVLKTGGRAVVLEFSRPKRFPVKQVYMFYFSRVLPLLGGMISGNTDAYAYLPDSVRAFPDGNEFEKVMQSVNFADIRSVPLTFGIATTYVGIK